MTRSAWEGNQGQCELIHTRGQGYSRMLVDTHVSHVLAPFTKEARKE